MISIVLNSDTRDGFDDPFSEAGPMFHGARSVDFLVHGLKNKIKFFEGFDVEFIMFVDEHNRVPNDVLDEIRPLVDKLVLSRHSKHYRGASPFGSFNDVNYLHALSLCRGKLVVHFDQDVAAFANSKEDVVAWLEPVTSGRYNFVSLPSTCSPDPVHDPSFQGKWWASTRAFACRRESLDITALEHAIREPQWAYETYGRPAREHGWTEHLLPLIAGYRTYYPPVDHTRLMIFPWSKYQKGTLEKLAGMSHSDIRNAVERAGGAGALYDGIDSTLMGI